MKLPTARNLRYVTAGSITYVYSDIMSAGVRYRYCWGHANADSIAKAMAYVRQCRLSQLAARKVGVTPELPLPPKRLPYVSLKLWESLRSLCNYGKRRTAMSSRMFAKQPYEFKPLSLSQMMTIKRLERLGLHKLRRK